MILRDYQISISDDAAGMLRITNICYLSMEVRTGKTLTALAATDKFGAKRVLFVTKKKAISSIQDDYDMLCPGFIIDIINYEQLHNIVSEYDLIIADEAHGLGQFPTPSERVRILKKICIGKPVILLSGTPTPESWSQIYHQLYISSFSPFAAYKNFYAWAKDFVTVRKKYFFNRQINDYSQADKNKIDSLIKHLFISYSQEQAGFTEFIEEEIILVRMKSSTYFLADKLRTKHVHIGKDGQEILADTAVKLMQKTHQVYSGTVKDEAGNGIVFDNSKASFIKEYFHGQKIAIFYKFIAERIMLIAEFGYDRLTEDPNEFNRGNKIFIAQIQSGREGINLSTADALVMLNIDFSAVSYWQSRARLQVKDRKKAAKVYWIFSENGIEHKIYKAVSNKKDYTLNYFKKDFLIATDIPEGILVENANL